MCCTENFLESFFASRTLGKARRSVQVQLKFPSLVSMLIIDVDVLLVVVGAIKFPSLLVLTLLLIFFLLLLLVVVCSLFFLVVVGCCKQTASVHTLHMFLQEWTASVHTCPKSNNGMDCFGTYLTHVRTQKSCSKCYGMDLGTYFTHVQT